MLRRFYGAGYMGEAAGGRPTFFLLRHLESSMPFGCALPLPQSKSPQRGATPPSFSIPKVPQADRHSVSLL